MSRSPLGSTRKGSPWRASGGTSGLMPKRSDQPSSDRDAVRACDCATFEIDLEAVLRVEPAGRYRILGLAPRVDAVLFEAGLVLSGPVRVVEAVALHRFAVREPLEALQ